MDRLPLLSFAATVLASAAPASVMASVSFPARTDASPALSIEQEVQRLVARGPDALWPGFDPRTIPLAVFDGERTYLFRHPAPPEEFIPVDGAEGVRLVYGRHEAVQADASCEIGGVRTAALCLDPTQPLPDALDLAAAAVEEGFRVHQRALHPDWTPNETHLVTHPVDSAEMLALSRLENEALRRALTGGEAETSECWARLALAMRAQRYERMDPASVACERAVELEDGLTAYVEMRAAGRRMVDLPAEGFGPNEMRRRAHLTGWALALVLDRVLPGWPSAFEANGVTTLDEVLSAALGEGKPCAFDAELLIATKKRAHADVAALAGERGRRLAAFQDRPGTRLVVETGGGEPLWPADDETLDAERMGATRVLHTRGLKLENGAGRIEVAGPQALTDGVGTYPLFRGVRRIELTGLLRPEVSEVDGKVSVAAPGVALEFSGAKVVRDGELIRVRLNR
jgi:hypothetical protein